MGKCISPISPLVALVGVEALIVAALAFWQGLAWIGLAAAPGPAVVLTAIIVNAAIMAALPAVHLWLNRVRRLNCPDRA